MQTQQAKSGYKYVRLIYNLHLKVPEDWQERMISSFAREKNQRYSKDKDGPVLSVTKYKGFVKSREYFKRQIYSKDIAKYKLVEKGDFAYATIHLDEGSMGLLKSYDRGYVSPMYTVFRTDSSINSDFLHLLLRSEMYLQIYRALGEGSINRRKSISFDKLSQLNIPVPTLEEQNKISLIISIMNQLIQNSDEIINHIQRLKKALMQRLLEKGFGHSRFKQTAIGKIPEEWEVSKLENILELCQYGLSEKLFDEGSYPVFRMNNITNGYVVHNDIKFTELDTQTFERFKLEKGDLLFNRTNSQELVGKVGIFLLDDCYTFASYLIRLRTNQKMNPYFLNYYLNTERVQSKLKNIATQGVSQSNINATNLKSFSIVIYLHLESSTE